jgi:polyvinyl alcohol dehydrogenase (cytochrome)
LAQPADGVPGAAVFTQTCAACHLPTAASGGMERAPKLETIKTFPPERIVDALTTGKMKAQGAALSDAQRRDVAEWIAGRKIGPESAASAMPDRCVGATAMKGLGGWNGWSPDRSNSRFQTASVAGIKAAEVPHLKLKWAFAFPGGAQVNSQPSVVGGWLFIGSDSGTIYALDAKTGCLHWTSKAGAAVRTAPVVAPLDGAKGPPTVFVGDLAGKLYAMDAANGRIVWSTQLDEMPQIRVMDAPAVYGGRLYVGVSSGEEGALGIAGYECCRFRGSVSALDSATGRILWKTYTVAEPKLTVDSAGVRRWGPAGGGSWSTPTIDVKRKLVYVTTGNAYAAPAGPLNDSVVALDLATGKVVWNHQETANDAWLFGCKDGMTGCPAKVGPDWDFSSSPMLKTLPDGRQLIVAANKGGVALGLDPDHAGAVVWRTTLYAKPPTFYGDVLFGGASDGSKAYYALQETNAVTAIRLKDGVKVWSHPFTPVAGRAERTGFGAALTAIPGVLFNGGWDGVLHALSASDGRQLWSFDTARPFKTVNGVEGKGGSMGGPGPTVAGGMLYVGSGYVGVSNGMAGNVLLAFAP